MSSFASAPSRGKAATPIETVARIGSLEVSTSKVALGDARGGSARRSRAPARAASPAAGSRTPRRRSGPGRRSGGAGRGRPRRCPQDRVAGEVAVGVVDVAQEVEVGHDQRERPVEARGPVSSSLQRRREVARVEEARLRVDAGLFLERGHGQRAVDQEERRDARTATSQGFDEPERGERDAERREHEVGREALEREEARTRGARGRARAWSMGASRSGSRRRRRRGREPGDCERVVRVGEGRGRGSAWKTPHAASIASV